MKHHHLITILRLVLLALPALLLNSCLKENPRDRIDEDQTFDSSTGLILNTLGTLYNYIGGSADCEGLQGTSRGIYDLNTFTTDEAMLPTRGGDWYDGGLWQALYMHYFNPGLEPIVGAWNYLYKVIVLCNQALEHLQKYEHLLTPEDFETFCAEVRGIRSLYYYYLLDMYGCVPYITSSNNMSVSDARQVSRSTLFYNLWNGLQDLLPKLADRRSNMEGEYYGRMTRHVAWFILAKLALNAEIWTDDDWTDDERPDGTRLMLDCEGEKLNAWEACIYWCDQLTMAGYKLEEDYRDNFTIYNEESKENIFVIPMDKTLYANQFVNLYRSRHYNHGGAIGKGAENGTCATVSTVKTYGYGTSQLDNRYDYNFYSDTVRVNGQVVYLDNGEPLVYKPLAVKLILSGTPDEKTAGARMKKYEIDPTAYADGKLQDNDIVLFRYADVLLMKAEAKVRNDDNGNYELNLVRQRVHMGWREATLKNILDERLMELQWEGWRRQDLVRFRLFHQAYDQRPQLADEDNSYTTVFPIPGRALNLNKQLKQNPGY